MLDQIRINHLALQLEGMGLRLDANETANLDRALRYVEAEAQRIEYPALQADRFIPLDTSIPRWASTVTYQVYDSMGEAKPIANFADDLPRADVVVFEEETPVKEWGGSYQYSVLDLERSAAPGATRLDSERATACRDVLEEKLDATAWFGYAPLKIRGFLNNEMVQVMSTLTDGGDTTWATKIANGFSGIQSVIADLNQMKTAIKVDTKEIHNLDTILMATSLYELIESTPYSDSSDKTILQWWKGNNPGVEVASSPRLDTANAAGTGPRIVGYKRSPTILKHRRPMGYTPRPPQAKNLAFVVNAWVRSAGTHIYRTKAVKYLDGAA